jgi:hypothetical protein
VTVQTVLERQEIEEIVHFTTNVGALGTLADRRLLSRAQLPTQKHLVNVYPPNARIRYDTFHLDYVNLSVSRINRRFFDASSSWHRNEDVWWCVLSFDPEIATHDGVQFATTNNRYSGCQRAAGAEGLEALFAERIHQYEDRWVTRSETSPRRWPTCRQAEVLYPGAVSTEHLRGIYVVNDAHHDVAAGWCELVGHGNVPVEVRPAVFE